MGRSIVVLATLMCAVACGDPSGSSEESARGAHPVDGGISDARHFSFEAAFCTPGPNTRDCILACAPFCGPGSPDVYVTCASEYGADSVICVPFDH